MNELGNTPADKDYKPGGISKAEERALEAYPPTFTSGKRYAKRVQSEKVDTHAPIRSIFIKGYEQAENDIISIIGIRISEILGDAQPKPALRAELEELIKRIKEEKK